MRIKPLKNYARAITPPPDKSVTQRALVMGWIAEGETKINNPSFCDDCISCMNCAADFGAEITAFPGGLTVKGGKYLSAKVNAGNSATAARLFLGAAAGRISGVIDGDASLRTRDVSATAALLSQMGAEIRGTRFPAEFDFRQLHYADLTTPYPSAQLKSAALLAGLAAEGGVSVTEKIPTRDHTERMLQAFGAEISQIEDERGNRITLKQGGLRATEIDVYGDFSAAAYPIALGLLRGKAIIRGVGLNPLRTGFMTLLKSVGANISAEPYEKGEKGMVVAEKSDLKAFTVAAKDVPSMIDELPLLAVVACFCDGESVLDFSLLRNKETDRLKAIYTDLKALGADAEIRGNLLYVRGGGLRGGEANSFGDHRIAMSMAVAGALSEKGVFLTDENCVKISYPEFFEDVIL